MINYNNFCKFLVLLMVGLLVVTTFSTQFHAYDHNSMIVADNTNDNHDNNEDCFLCLFANFSLEILLSLALVLILNFSYFFHILARLTRLKLSFLLTLRFPTGPPLTAI